jgi:tRNA nucleotidyltransferase (CCA-adding enzyme)
VPVIHPESGQVIGIVTRTDLLKTLAPEARMSGRQNLANRLEAVLPAPRLALIRAIASAAHEMHLALYVVGGFVRDLLLERPGLDFDLVVEGDAIGLAYSLAKRYGGRVTSHARFGTAKWYLGEKGLAIGDQGMTKDNLPAVGGFPTPAVGFPPEGRRWGAVVGHSQ